MFAIPICSSRPANLARPSSRRCFRSRTCLPDDLSPLNAQQVWKAARGELFAKLRRVTVARVAQDYVLANAPCESGIDEIQRDLPLLLEPNVVRDANACASLAIV